MQNTGQWGEEAAWQHYRSKGYQLLARNWRPADASLRRLELDLVLLNPAQKEWVVVEVKTRRSPRPPDPQTVLPPTKLQALWRAAEAWLSTQPEPWLPLTMELAVVTLRTSELSEMPILNISITAL